MPKIFSLTVLVWVILALVWSTTWIVIKVGLEDLPPIAFSSARFLLSVAVLFVIVHAKRIPLPKTSAEWKLVALTGVLQFSLNYSAVFWAEQYITSGLAAVLQAMIPVFGLLLAWIHLPHERITAQKMIAVLLGIIGVTVIFLDQLRVENWMAFAGCVAIVVGAYAAAHSSILIKAKAAGIHPVSLVFWQMLCGLPAIVVYSLLTEGNPLNHRWTSRAVLGVVYLALFGSVLAFWLYYWLLRRVESTKAMMISLVTPLLAVVIGAVAVGETLPLQTYLGGSLIMGSIALIVFRKRIKPDRSRDAEVVAVG
jgi:drug/metabolite transporter (DMT)-like permease